MSKSWEESWNICRLSIREEKIQDYLLNAAHPVGSSKCEFFESVGFSRNHPDKLHAALLQQASSCVPVLSKECQYGYLVHVDSILRAMPASGRSSEQPGCCPMKQITLVL
ncbi:MAG: DUF6883 domain-containing protein [Opitutales bacterium]